MWRALIHAKYCHLRFYFCHIVTLFWKFLGMFDCCCILMSDPLLRTKHVHKNQRNKPSIRAIGMKPIFVWSAIRRTHLIYARYSRITYYSYTGLYVSYKKGFFVRIAKKQWQKFKIHQKEKRGSAALVFWLKEWSSSSTSPKPRSRASLHTNWQTITAFLSVSATRVVSDSSLKGRHCASLSPRPWTIDNPQGKKTWRTPLQPPLPFETSWSSKTQHITLKSAIVPWMILDS